MIGLTLVEDEGGLTLVGWWMDGWIMILILHWSQAASVNVASSL